MQEHVICQKLKIKAEFGFFFLTVSAETTQSHNTILLFLQGRARMKMNQLTVKAHDAL